MPPWLDNRLIIILAIVLGSVLGGFIIQKILIARIRSLDPDILTGWNLVDFDLPRLATAASAMSSTSSPSTSSEVRDSHPYRLPPVAPHRLRSLCHHLARQESEGHLLDEVPAVLHLDSTCRDGVSLVGTPRNDLAVVPGLLDRVYREMITLADKQKTVEDTDLSAIVDRVRAQPSEGASQAAGPRA